MAFENAHHLDYYGISRTGHWSPASQNFAGAHNLLWALDHGWQLDPEVVCMQYPRGKKSTISIYHFILHRDDDHLVMPVIDTPYVARLIAERGLHVRSTEAEVSAQNVTA